MSPDSDLSANPQTARQVAEILRHWFGDRSMPEDAPLPGVAEGSYQHLMFLTLTTSLDYMRDSAQLWEASRHAFEIMPHLFDPRRIAQASYQSLLNDLHNSGVSRRPNKDAHIWTAVSRTLLEKWDANPMRLVELVNYDAPTLLQAIRNEHGFPYLGGPKISALWIRMLRDNARLQLKNMDKIPIPIDVHIVRATLSTGVLTGTYEGTLYRLRDRVARVWQESLAGTHLMPLDVDKPLWHLSRDKCTQRLGGVCPATPDCPVSRHCARGFIRISGDRAEIQT